MVTYPSTTKLIDTFIVEFNSKITDTLTWLNNPLGKAESISKSIDGTNVVVPAMHTDSGEYIEVLPDDTLVNYSWFVFGPIEVINNMRSARLKVSCDWNLYFNVEEVTGESEARAIENIKDEVGWALSVLSLRNAAIRFTPISESFKDIYKNYSISSVEDRYFMQPYGGLSIKMDVYLRNNVCS